MRLSLEKEIFFSFSFKNFKDFRSTFTKKKKEKRNQQDSFAVSKYTFDQIYYPKKK